MVQEYATISTFVILLFVLVPLFYWIGRARKTEVFVRRIAGVDAIDEAVGRSTELGRPILFTTGLTDVGPVLYACLGIIAHVAEKAATLKTRLLLPQINPENIAIVESTVREAYRSVGKSASFDPQTVMFMSGDQFAFASGYSGLTHRENVGAAFLFGEFKAESLILAEAGQQVGAMQIAASLSPEQVAFFVCTCDYTLIGEELFGAAAYLTKEPVLVGSLRAQDIAKLAIVALILLGTIASTIKALYPTLFIPTIGDLFSDTRTLIEFMKGLI